MNFKTKKNLILASSILSFISFAVALLGSVLFLSVGLSALNELVIATEPYAKTLIIGLSVLLIFFSIIALAAGILLFKTSKFTKEEFETRRGFYVTAVVLGCFSGSFITLVVLLCAFFSGNSEERENANFEELDEQGIKLKRLKELFDNGTITESEYHDLVIKILK